MSTDYLYPWRYSFYYKKAVKLRALQEELAGAYQYQRMRCPMHLSIGQEHWLPVFGGCIRKGDRIFSSHRSHSMYMAVSNKFEKLIAELHGLEDGCLKGKGGSMHLKDLEAGLESSTPIVGSSLGISLGSALASKHLDQDVLTVAYFGDGACEEGILHEALNLASVHQLPILFLCENNIFSCNTAIDKRQPSNRMTRFADAHCIHSVRIEYGASFESIHEKLQLASQAARQEPVFVEINTFRLYEHCGHLPDPDQGDRSKFNYTDYCNRDPINLLLGAYDELQKEYREFRSLYKSMIESFQEVEIG